MIKLISCTNPQWANAEKTELYADVQWSVTDKIHKTHLSKIDVEEHVISLIKEIEEGAYGIISSYAAPSQEELDAKTSAAFRSERDSKLISEVDPLVTNPLRWTELTEAKQTEWTQYRRDLLDITDQEGFPNEFTWPIKPE